MANPSINTRLIFTELEKLKTYALGKIVNGDTVKELVSESAANTLQLANAIRLGNIAQALEFVERLINCNEPAFTQMLYSLRVVLLE